MSIQEVNKNNLKQLFYYFIYLLIFHNNERIVFFLKYFRLQEFIHFTSNYTQEDNLLI